MSINAEQLKLSELMRSVKGFFIPIFQRPYTWSNDDISRLFETITDSLDRILEGDSEYESYLGAILAVENREMLRSHYEIDISVAPDSINMIIDGQQRLTTLVLLCSALLKRIRKVKADIPSKLNEMHVHLDEIEDIALDFCTIVNFRSGTDDVPKHLPKIINQKYGDQWHKRKQGKYKSPVAGYLSSIINNISNTAAWETENEVIQNSLRHLDDIVEKYIQSDDRANALSKAQLRIGDVEVQLLLNLAKKAPKIDESIRRQFIALVLLVRFIQDKVTFSYIKVNNENLAFQIFDVLNSTGDPLTAMETYKPLALRFSQAKAISVFEEFDQLVSDQKRDSRHKFTQQFVVAVAYYLTGRKVGEKYNEQREYLVRSHNNYSTQLMDAITDIMTFYNEVWLGKAYRSLEVEAEVKVCLSLLINARHTIVVPILARFYIEFVEKTNKVEEFEKAVKAITCFSTIWRLLHNGGTGSIDTLYAKLLFEKLCQTKSKSLTSKLLIDELKSKLETYKTKNKTLPDSIKEYLRSTQYRDMGGNIWLKFFLLAAENDSVADEKPGHLAKGTPGSKRILTLNNWEGLGDLMTIEHIVPQNPASIDDWDNTLYAAGYLHSLGNLTLLPKQKNSLAGNRPWGFKRKLFQILGESIADDRAAQIDKLLTSESIRITKKTESLLLKAEFWPCALPLGKVARWDPALVQSRTKNYIDRAWEEIAAWLGF